MDHPFFLGRSWRLPSSHPDANPLLGGDAVPGFAWRRLFGKPFCVTEWNWSAPGQFRQASGLVMGALAARQGWNGLWRFAWSHDRAGGRAIRKSRRNLRKNGKSDVAKTGSKTPPNSEVKRRQNRKHCIPEGGVVA